MRILTLACCLTGLVLLGGAACSSSSTATNAATPGAADAGADADPATPADVPCDPPKITFQKSPIEITPTRDHHHTLIHEVNGVPYLYVIGGEQEDFATVHADIQRAKINDDGSIGAFEDAGKLPIGRAGAGFAVIGDDVILAGGSLPKGFTNTTSVGRFDAAGRLDTWDETGPKLPQSVMHAAAVTIDHDIYVFGGTTGADASTVSVKMTLSPDGKLSTPVPLTKLDPKRSHHVAFVDKGAIYLVGGLDKGPVGNPPSRKDAVRATVQSDGTIGEWESVGALDHPLSISSVVQIGCSYLFPGGLDDTNKDGTYSNHILRASIGGDGSFKSEGVLEQNLSFNRGHVHQTPVYKQFLYSVGGRDNDFNTIGSVDIGTIAQ